jgi:diadenosine tetraphosphate (Ap4A) HIT family hydrolase
MNFPMPVMEPCYFCEIARRGMADWNVIARDELTVTVLNGRQYEAGQCIVFPVRHAPTVLDLTALEAGAVMCAAQRIAAAITRALEPQALLLYQNNGILSGQEVPHFHLHVVPRSAGSDWGDGPPHLARAQAGNLATHRDYTQVSEEKARSLRLIQRALAGSS